MTTNKSGKFPELEFGGSGPLIHFAHANGFPAASYQEFINELVPDHRVIAMNARPLWPDSNYRDFNSWEIAANDLIEYLDKNGHRNIIGMGHSFGAICTLIAAQKRPDLFSKLILIEPVVLPSWYYQLTSILPQILLKRINPIVKKTLVRKEHWPDHEAAFTHFRRSRLFASVSDTSIWNYVNSVTAEKNGGVSLVYSKEWEATIFLTVINPWKALQTVGHATLIFRGETSDTIFPNVWKQMKAKIDRATLVEIADAGHLVPIEKPEEIARNIKDFLHSDR